MAEQENKKLEELKEQNKKLLEEREKLVKYLQALQKDFNNLFNTHLVVCAELKSHLNNIQ